MGAAACVELRAPRLLLAERTPQERRHPREREEVMADLRGDQDLGVSIAAERPPHRVVAGDTVE